LYEEGGVWLKGAVEPLGLIVDFLPIDSDALGECIARIGMVSFEFDVAANAAWNVDCPIVGAGRNFLPGLDQNLLAYGWRTSSKLIRRVEGVVVSVSTTNWLPPSPTFAGMWLMD
jgi:hypothetical protein